MTNKLFDDTVIREKSLKLLDENFNEFLQINPADIQLFQGEKLISIAVEVLSPNYLDAVIIARYTFIQHHKRVSEYRIVMDQNFDVIDDFFIEY